LAVEPEHQQACLGIARAQRLCDPRFHRFGLRTGLLRGLAAGMAIVIAIAGSFAAERRSGDSIATDEHALRDLPATGRSPQQAGIHIPLVATVSPSETAAAELERQQSVLTEQIHKVRIEQTAVASRME